MIPQEEPRLTLIEGAVLGVLVEEPRHGFAVAREFASDGWIGGTFTAHRPVVYRALHSLEAKGLLEVGPAEATTSGPDRRVVGPNAEGEQRLTDWVGEPVPHMRDVRVDFLVKLALHDRLGLNPAALIQQQYAVLEPIYESLQKAVHSATGFELTAALWRAENSESVMRFLSRLMAAN